MDSIALLVMAAQSAALVAVAWLVPHRGLLAAALLGVLAGGAVLGHPADLAAAPGALMVDLAAALGGFAAGWWLVGWRRVTVDRARARRRASAKAGGDADRAPVPTNARRTATGFVAGLLLALGAAAGGWLWIGGDVPAAAHQAIERWRVAVTHAWAASQAPVKPVPGRRDPAAPSAAPGGTSDPASAVASASAAAAARPRATGVAVERPSGDLRHCLDRGQGADVARCAEGQ
jgi:hypothetical protein